MGPVLGKVSGSPCQPWSRRGNGAAVQTRGLFLLVCWARWVREAALRWVIHENALGLDAELLVELFGDTCAMPLTWQ